MAKLHNALTNAELHNPKGITSNSTASIMELNQAQSAISSSADFVPTTNETYDLGSATQAWKEIFVSTSSINFVDPSGNTVQTIKATTDGVTFSSGSGAVANVSASIISGSALHIEGGAKVTGDLTLGGQITMGDADTDDVVFEAEVSSSLIPNDNNAFDLGTAAKQWKNIYSAGTISGSTVTGTTLGQNRADGVKTITIEANSTVNQDLTTDASPTFAGTTNGNVQVGVTGDNELDTSTGNLTIDSQGGTITIDDILSVAGAATFDSTVLSTGNLSTAGILSGSSTAFFGQYGVSYISASAGSIQATNYVSGSEIKSPTGTLGSLSVGNVTSTGTVSGSAVYGTLIGQNRTDGLKTITIEENSTIDQDVTQDANVTFNNITSTGTVTGSAVHGTEIGQTRVDGVKTLTIEANSTVNQDLTSDANVTFGTIASVGNINSTGNISGSTVYGTTIGQTRVDGLKTITIEANSIINQDLSTDADATLGTLGVGNITSTGVVKTSGIISGSDEAFFGQYGVNYVSASNGSLQATNYLSGSHVRASDIQVGMTAANEIDTAQGNLILDSAGGTVQITDTLDVDGDISLVTQATDIDLVDNNSSALSFDASGKAGILEVDTTDGSEKVKMSGGVDVTGTLSGATISGSSIDGTAIRHNTATGLHSLVLNENLTVSDGQNVVLAAAGQANTFTMNESLTVGDGNSGTITYSGASKTLTVEDSATVNQDLTTDAGVTFATVDTGQGANELYDMDQNVKTDSAVTFAGLTSTGDVVLTGQATDIDLIDNNATALTFDAGAGGTSVLTIDTRNSAERIVVTGDVSASGDFRSISTSTGSFGHLDVSTISGSGTVATLASATLSETPLDVSSGGTGTDTLSNKAVLISQDSGTDTIGTAVMGTNGQILVGGSSGPAVMAASTIAGTGVDAATGDGTITLSTSAAQTTITSIYATDLIMGEDAETAIDFGTNNQISFKTNNAEDFRMVAGGTFHANADVVAFSSTIASDMNLKKNITDTKYGLDTVMQLRGVEYDWKREDKGHDVGVLAQEVEAVVPELVKEVDGLKGKFKAVDYNKLVPILIESIKELKIELDSYKALQEIDELKH